MTTTSTVTVEGMTCDHCVRAVQSELADVPGVAAVDVDLATGRVAITADRPLDDGAVREAVEAAGYQVAS